MTTQRRHGEDTPFGAWVRRQPKLDSRNDGLTVNDIDWIFHNYSPPIDGKRTREVQIMMIVEVKTLSAIPGPSQKETLFFTHQRTKGMGTVTGCRGQSVRLWHFGAFVLRLSGLSPTDSNEMSWGKFGDNGELLWRRFTAVDELIEVLGLRLNPDTFSMLETRPHHLTREITMWTQTPLGFWTEEKILKRS